MPSPVINPTSQLLLKSLHGSHPADSEPCSHRDQLLSGLLRAQTFQYAVGSGSTVAFGPLLSTARQTVGPVLQQQLLWLFLLFTLLPSKHMLETSLVHSSVLKHSYHVTAQSLGLLPCWRLSPSRAKAKVGWTVVSLIKATHPSPAGKVTGVLLGVGDSEPLHMLQCWVSPVYDWWAFCKPLKLKKLSRKEAVSSARVLSCYRSSGITLHQRSKHQMEILGRLCKI